MAWTTVYPNLVGGGHITGGSSTGYVDFATYHLMRGNIQMRLIDVTYDSGYHFSTFDQHIAWVDSSGTVRGTATLNKSWGVTPGFTAAGNLGAAGDYVHLRITSANDTPSNVGGAAYTATWEVQYDG